MSGRWTLRVVLTRYGAALLLGLLAPIAACAFDFRSLFDAGGDGGSGKLVKLAFHLKENFIPTSIAWSPGGRYIASAGVQSTDLHIWDAAQQRLVKQLELPYPPAGRFQNMSWSPDGRYLAICGAFSSSLRVYETKTWAVAKDFGRADAGACRKPLFSEDGKELTVWAGDLVTWDIESWREKRRLKGVWDDGQYIRPLKDGWDAGQRIRDVAYLSRTHTLIFAGGRYENQQVSSCDPAKPSYTSRLWMLDPPEHALRDGVVVHCTYVGGGTDVELVAASPDAVHTALSVWQRDNRRVVDIVTYADGRIEWTPVAPGPGRAFARALAYTPDGKYLLIGMDNGLHESGSVILVDPNRRQVLDIVRARGAAVVDLALSAESKMLAAAAGTYITVWQFIND